MKVLKNISLFAKGLSLLLILVGTAASVKAQDAIIYNNTTCSMKVVIGGLDDCSQCLAQNAVIVAPNTSVQVTPTGNGCTIDHVVAVNVKATCDNANVTVGDIGCSNCPGSITDTDYFTVSAGCCYAVDKQIEVIANCLNADLIVHINE